MQPRKIQKKLHGNSEITIFVFHDYFNNTLRSNYGVRQQI